MNCVVLEDSVNGVIAAKAAKMKCIAVPDAHERDNKEFGEADRILNSLEELSESIIQSL